MISEEDVARHRGHSKSRPQMALNPQMAQMGFVRQPEPICKSCRGDLRYMHRLLENAMTVGAALVVSGGYRAVTGGRTITRDAGNVAKEDAMAVATQGKSAAAGAASKATGARKAAATGKARR